MANNKSAKKRIKINRRNRLQNKYYKTSLRTLLKLFFINLDTYKTSSNDKDKNKAQEILNSIYSLMDKATKKKIMSKNKSAKKKSKLATYLKVA